MKSRSFPTLHVTSSANVEQVRQALEAWLSGSSREEIEKRLGTSRSQVDSSGSYTHWVWERISPTHFVGWEYSAPPESVEPGQTCPAGRWSVTRATGNFRIEQA